MQASTHYIPRYSKTAYTVSMLYILWSIMIVSIYMIQKRERDNNITELATMQANYVINKDMNFRILAAEHGGFYVPITEQTPPNPYLSHIQERDITTPSGKKLTLLNPAYMIRQLNELGEKHFDIKSRITSLKPIRALNSPDIWEAKALKLLEAGMSEFSEMVPIGSKNFLRLMRPLITEKSCLKCHAAQGYKEGDIRGGISVSIDIAPLLAIFNSRFKIETAVFFALWLMGLILMFAVGKRLKLNTQKRIMAEQKADAFEKTSHVKEMFLANMSHEIRTPVNAIIGFTHLLYKTSLTEAQINYLKKMDISANHLLSVINDILDISKLEANKLFLEYIDFDLSKMLEQTIAIVDERVKTKRLSIFLTVNSDVPLWLNGEPTRLRQSLLNLLANAVKFTEKGFIEIRIEKIEKNSVSEQDLYLKFSVIDTGIGIDNKKIPYLFKAFEQVDNSTTRIFGGTGLGLTITKQLTEMMGGEVGVESHLGEGSTFWFTALLKLAKTNKYQELGQVNSKNDYEKILQQRHEGSRILLVEDNTFNVEVAIELLQQAGLVVDAVENGRLAIEAIKNNEYQLVLMDMQMPEMDGLEATQTIRLRKKYRKLPIIGISANVAAEDRLACINAGMDDFIAKPFTVENFYQTIALWLDKTKKRQLKAELKKVKKANKANKIDRKNQLAIGESSTKSEKEINLTAQKGTKLAEVPKKAAAVLTKKEQQKILIDPAMLTKLMGDNPQKHQQMLKKFLIQAENIKNDLELAFTEKNMQQLSFLGHKLKSSARTVGANQLADVCYALEVAGKSEQWEQLESDFSLFLEEFSQLKHYIE